MRNGGRERVSSIVWLDDFFHIQVMTDGFLHVFFRSATIARHGLLNLERSVFVNRKIMFARNKHTNTTSLSNGYTGSNVLVEEEFLSFVYAISIISNSERVAKNTLPAFSNPVFNGYIDSIISINEYKFNDAIICLLDVLTRTDNFFVKYFTAKNLELCYKEIEDFKNAYEYAKMRLDLLDKFND